jgi:hypothetical protein
VTLYWWFDPKDAGRWDLATVGRPDEVPALPSLRRFFDAAFFCRVAHGPVDWQLFLSWPTLTPRVAPDTALDKPTRLCRRTVRKGFAFPLAPSIFLRLCLRGRRSLHKIKMLCGKAEPYRTVRRQSRKLSGLNLNLSLPRSIGIVHVSLEPVAPLAGL